MHDTTALLDSLYQQTELHLQKALREWQMLPPALLAVAPAPGQWSAAQCLEHLNIYGRYYLPAIEKAIARGRQRGWAARPTFQSGWLGRYFTQLMLPQTDGRLKKKMQSPANARPTAQPDAVAVLTEFIDQQEKMLQLLEAARSVDLRRAKVPISIAPWLRLRLGDTFGFMTAHIYRHLLQAERALAIGEMLLRQPAALSYTVPA